MLKGYLGDISKEMVRKSEAIRRDFATHRLSGGENREDLLQKFLRDHLPLRFGVHRGLVFSSEGLFSNQAGEAFAQHPIVLDENDGNRLAHVRPA